MSDIDNSRKKRIVAVWLLFGVFMIIIQIALGGLTRLTGSGLSMTEWQPIMGFIPPLNHEQWMQAFEKYQEIAQYKYVNSHFSLTDFQYIFFWEWFHRMWARFLAVAFLIPFVYFLVRKYFSKEMITPLILLFVFGGLQGFIGWYMVQSGLNEEGLRFVSHIRLAVHLVSALGLLCYTLWFALQLLIPKEKVVSSTKTRNFFLLLMALLTAQLFYGAFMAGLHAAAYAPSWPKMNGFWIPPGLGQSSWIDNPMNVQFVHRGLAYLLLILMSYGFYIIWKLAKEHGSALLRKTSVWLIVLIIAQVTLGIFTVISSPFIVKEKFGVFETLAQTHQLVAMLLVVVLMMVLYLVRGDKRLEKAS